jgi:hypothetical protein
MTRYNKWTEEQEEMVLNKPENMTWKELNASINSKFGISRSEKSTYAKYLTLRMQPSIDAIKETIGPVEKVKEQDPSFERTRKRWTPQEELEILVYFYDLSVDDARKRWQRPYWAIAKRLEHIYDSEEPRYADMLMAASRLIQAIKQQESEPPQMSRRERRKLRKMAKKEAALVAKLKKLRRE